MSWRERSAAVEAALQGARFGSTWIRVECPFCAEAGHRDRKRSLSVNAGSGKFFCFRCEEYGWLEEPPDPGAALLPQREVPAGEFTEMARPDEFVPLWEEPYCSAISFAPARRYLRTRSVNRKVARELEIGACDEGYWRGRVIVPLRAPDGTWLGWSARVWNKVQGSSVPPYLYPRGMPRGEFLWNQRAIYEETDVPVLVVEGVFDAMGFYPNVVATLGKPAHSHLEILAGSAERPVVFVPDGDAWEPAWSFAQRLRFEGKRAGYVKLPPKTDPDEVDRDWVINQAQKSLRRVL